MKKLNMLLIAVILNSTPVTAGDIPTESFSDYENKMMSKALTLYNKRSYSGRFADGFYTEPDKNTQVYEFWCNGKWAKYDRDADGHHETFFKIENGGKIMEYVGTIGGDATFIRTSSKTKHLLGKSSQAWIDTLD